MEIGVGDVVRFKGKEQDYVVIKTDIHDMASMCYDRDYYIMSYDDVIRTNYILEQDILHHLRIIKISVSPNSEYKDIPFEIVPNVAPFEIKKEVTYHFRQKRPKTITVYE